MCRKTHTATLTPAGLAVDGVEIRAAKIIVMARPSTKTATCPECGVVSGRIHSRYRRRLIDLPAHGRIVEINVETRRFRCVEQAAGGAFSSSASVRRSHCRQPAEQCGWMASCIASGSHWAGGPDITWQAAWQSRSAKIPCLERFAGGARPRDSLRAVGIDDWAWRKGCQYGTVICDLERRRIVALLPDRASGTSAAWLREPQHRVHCPGSWRELRRRRIQGCAPGPTNRRSLAPLRKRQRELS